MAFRDTEEHEPVHVELLRHGDEPPHGVAVVGDTSGKEVVTYTVDQVRELFPDRVIPRSVAQVNLKVLEKSVEDGYVRLIDVPKPPEAPPPPVPAISKRPEVPPEDLAEVVPPPSGLKEEHLDVKYLPEKEQVRVQDAVEFGAPVSPQVYRIYGGKELDDLEESGVFPSLPPEDLTWFRFKVLTHAAYSGELPVVPPPSPRSSGEFVPSGTLTAAEGEASPRSTSSYMLMARQKGMAFSMLKRREAQAKERKNTLWGRVDATLEKKLW